MMGTTPYEPQAEAALRQSLRHRASITCTPQGGAPFTLGLESGVLAFDETWAPHGSLSASIATPEDPAQVAALDGRLRSRLTVSAGYQYPGGLVDVHPLADLALSRVTTRHPGDVLEVDAYTDESLILDWTPLGQTKTFAPNTVASTAITDLIQWGLSGAVVVSTIPSSTFVAAGEVFTVTTGANVWEVISDIADRVGAWVRHDGATWRIDPRPVLGESRTTLQTGKYGTVTNAESDLDRSTFYNAVLVVHTWRDAAGVDRTVRGWAEVIAGPLAVAAVGRETYVVERDTPATNAQAILSARAVLKRTLLRGSRVRVTAVAAYWLRPGMTVRLVMGGVTRDLLVSSIEFNLTDGSMSLVLRRPEDDAEISTGS